MTPDPVSILRELAAQASGLNYESRRLAMNAADEFARVVAANREMKARLEKLESFNSEPPPTPAAP